jgi:hypothetical protein
MMGLKTIRYFWIKLTFFVSIFLVAVSTQAEQSTIEHPRETWPKIQRYEIDHCISVEQASKPSEIQVEQNKLRLSFHLTVTGGDIVVNPTITEFSDTLTLSFEGGRTKVNATACVCFERVTVVIQTDTKRLKTVYVVQDKTVVNEILIP